MKYATATTSSKVILSGEYAAVWGGPAIAITRPDYRCKITLEEKDSPGFSIHFTHSDERFTITQDWVVHHQSVIHGSELSPKDFIGLILQHFFEASFLKSEAIGGMHIRIDSNIFIGGGLGFSAALIVSLLRGLSDYFELNSTDEWIFELGRKIEDLQHYKSSGLDIAAVLTDGYLYYQGKQMDRYPDIQSVPIDMFFTGKPATSTGDSVKKVLLSIIDPKTKAAFIEVTHDMHEAILNQDWASMGMVMKKNHRLLVDLGVVPKEIQGFISRVEALGGAAKISGAGAVKGAKAGLVIGWSPKNVAEVLEEYPNIGQV